MLLAEDGRKMSKRLRNYPEPTEMIDRMEPMRCASICSTRPPSSGEVALTEDGIKESLRSVIYPFGARITFL